jgi:hypothetical protein
MFFTISVRLASGQRSFSRLKPMKKDYLISAINPDKLNSLAVTLIKTEDARTMILEPFLKIYRTKI